MMAEAEAIMARLPKNTEPGPSAPAPDATPEVPALSPFAASVLEHLSLPPAEQEQRLSDRLSSLAMALELVAASPWQHLPGWAAVAAVAAQIAPPPAEAPATEADASWRRFLPWRWLLARQQRTLRRQKTQLREYDSRLAEVEQQAAQLAAYVAQLYGVAP